MNQFLNGTRQVQFAGNTIQFDIGHRNLFDAVDTHFAHCISADGNIISEYQVRAEEKNLFSISRDGVPLVSNATAEQVLSQLMQDGLTQLNGAASTQLVFHAAALAHQGRGLVLCGQSGSGKSTLTAWLTASGMNYLTDEVISAPLDSENIYGFCRSIVLKSGSSFVWEKWLSSQDAAGFLRFADHSAWIQPSLFNLDGPQATAVPRLIIFPHYEPDAAFQVERLTPAGTLFHLLQHLVNARNFPDYGMAATSRLASRVAAYQLTYSDIEMASEWIQKTIQQS